MDKSNIVYPPLQDLEQDTTPKIDMEIECHLFGPVLIMTCNTCHGQVIISAITQNWRFEIPCSYACSLKLFSGGIS